jgi:hypothetical protein
MRDPVAILVRLHQDKYWVNAQGDIIPLEKMSIEHRENLVAWLRRHAAELKRHHDTDRRDFCNDPYCGETPPEEWLNGTPLMKRLMELVSRNFEEEEEVDVKETGVNVKLLEEVCKFVEENPAQLLPPGGGLMKTSHHNFLIVGDFAAWIACAAKDTDLAWTSPLHSDAYWSKEAHSFEDGTTIYSAAVDALRMTPATVRELSTAQSVGQIRYLVDEIIKAATKKAKEMLSLSDIEDSINAIKHARKYGTTEAANSFTHTLYRELVEAIADDRLGPTSKYACRLIVKSLETT